MAEGISLRAGTFAAAEPEIFTSGKGFGRYLHRIRKEPNLPQAPAIPEGVVVDKFAVLRNKDALDVAVFKSAGLNLQQILRKHGSLQNP